MSEKLEIIYSCLRRLIPKYNSERFAIRIDVRMKEKSKKINFETSIKKARVLSKNINEINLTIIEYEILLPT